MKEPLRRNDTLQEQLAQAREQAKFWKIRSQHLATLKKSYKRSKPQQEEGDNKLS